MPKRLIINADDFGLAEDANRCIIDCRRQGALTDMSILAVGEAFGHAAKLARENNVSRVGAHLALTGAFKPVSDPGGIPTLLEGGKFCAGYASFLIKLLSGRVKTEQIYTELRNQIKKIKGAGFAITHADSHHHIHMVPSMLRVVLRLASEEGIGYVRFPLERIDMPRKLQEPLNGMRNIMLSSMCGLSFGILKESGMKHNDYFLGHFNAHGMKKNDLFSSVAGLSEGLTELAVHPAHFTEYMKDRYPYFRNAEKEAKILCSADFKNLLKSHSINLVTCPG